MSQEKILKWQASFNIKPPLALGEIKNPTNFKIIKENDRPDAKAIGLEVTIDEPTEEKATTSAINIANTVAACLTFLKGVPVKAHLSSIANLSSSKPSTQFIFIGSRFVLDASQDVDFTTNPIRELLSGQNIKLHRQLAHYQRALETEDIITKIREFYQVVEDEYPSDHSFIQAHIWARHLVSHPELNNTKRALEAMKHLGKTYIDPLQDSKKLQAEMTDI